VGLARYARPLVRRARDFVGLALAVAGIAFVVARLAGEWGAVRGALAERPAMVFLVAALGAAAMGITGVAVLWGIVLRRLGADVAMGDAVRWFFVGEVAKYVPIGVGGVIGRAEMAVRHGVPRRVAYRSVLVSLVSFYALVPALPAWLAIMGSTAAVADRKSVV
jgi:uncharacterized membrane protein YtjA (UPF0391 family)